METTDTTGDHKFGQQAEKPLANRRLTVHRTVNQSRYHRRGKVGVLVKAWWAPNIQWDVQWLIKTTTFPRIVHHQVGMDGQSVIPGALPQSVKWWWGPRCRINSSLPQRPTNRGTGVAIS